MENEPVEESESNLVRRAGQGDERAFHVLVDRHAQHLFAAALALLGRVPDAEDVVQETFTAAFQGIGRFEGRSSFRTWLVSILTRKSALWHRKRRPLERSGTEAGPNEPRAQVTSSASQTDARLDVTQVLQELSPEHREVLVLREFEGLSYEEMAAALDVPRGTVESRLYRARQEMRARLVGYQP